MPTVTLNRKTFEKHLGAKLSDEKLKDRISMIGTDLEELNKEEIHVEIFPNRPDMLSEQGFARAMSSFIGVHTGLPNYKLKKSGKKVIVDSTKVKMRPYTACAIAKGITFTDEKIREIMQIQEKLATTHGRNRKKSAYGFYPTNAITFPITYTAEDPKKVEFWPLGMPKPMRADDVEELHPKGREYKWIADNWKKQGHTKYPFFVDAKKNYMCMLPYTNSHDTGKVEIDTTEVFIECTGVDEKNVNVALNIFVTMLADMGGEIYTLDIQYPDRTVTTPNLTPATMDLDVNYINTLLGLSLSENESITLLKRMGYGYDKKSKKVLVPAYRADILHPADLSEDIAIAYGYENFEEEIPNAATIGSESGIEVFKRNLNEILIGLGLLECKHYHLTSKDNQTTKMNVQIPLVGLANALNEEYNVLSAWNIPYLLEILKNNKHHEYPQNIFSTNGVFQKGQTDTGVAEAERLACALCSENADYTRIRQVIDYLFRMLGVEYTVEETEHDSFISGRVGRVIVKGKKVAYIGEISPAVLEKWELGMPVSAFELNVSELYEVFHG